MLGARPDDNTRKISVTVVYTARLQHATDITVPATHPDCASPNGRIKGKQLVREKERRAARATTEVEQAFPGPELDLPGAEPHDPRPKDAKGAQCSLRHWIRREAVGVSTSHPPEQRGEDALEEEFKSAFSYLAT